MMRRFLLALPLILAACSEEPAAPPAGNESVERPTAPGPEAPPPTPKTVDAGTIPAAFRGEWNRTAADCGTGNNDSRLRIEAKRLRFHESSGDVIAVHGEGRTITVRARYSGEGETWEDARSFTLSADGNTLSADGIERTRCT
ncbi:hypothetical protein OK349_18435 [Sphingomonas sp. BT-65]|uniref:hypothetical protein n=1 Tax=Sphingomonas sp. BT-65 TaxID=2989821 RepID=UPI0022362F93|nr:hypothetical protein [Sphingomonas sp. BT-65]MCW4463688.1 hypothetical protein [Sphingomonas sp. BT-65]